MKVSRYNHYWEKGDKSYFYNALNNSYFRLPKSTGQKLHTVLATPTFIANSLPDLYANLCAKGFIIKDEIDELEIVRSNHRAAVDSKNAFLVILPTLNCNYKCWYCIQNHVGGKMHDDVKHRIKKLINHWIKVDKIQSLHIEWFGGEPFMYYNDVVYPLSKYAKEACAAADIPFINSATTNAYFLTEEITKDFIDLKLNSFQITLDGNRENHNEVKQMKQLESSFDRALSHINTILLQNPQATILLRINYTHENLNHHIVDEVCRLIDINNRERVQVVPRKVWQVEPDSSCQELLFSIMKRFREVGFKVDLRFEVSDFISCYANKRFYAAVAPDGRLVKCTANNDLFDPHINGQIANDGSLIWHDDFDKMYCETTFENEECLACNRLPRCMGACPKEHVTGNNWCKFKSIDTSFEDSIMEYIDSVY